MKQLLREKPRKDFLQKIIVFVILLMFLTSSVIFSRLGFFTVSKIECRTQYGECSEEDTQAFIGFIGENLLFINTNKVKLTGENNFSNRKVVVQRTFPGTLVIVLEKRKGVVLLKSIDGKSPVLSIDKDGTVRGIISEEGLPIITVNRGLESMYLGEKIELFAIHAVQLMYLLNRAKGISEGLLNEDSLQVTLSEGTQVNFALDRDPQALVGALQLIETRSRIEGKLPKLIDLRYIKPVLKYE